MLLGVVDKGRVSELCTGWVHWRKKRWNNIKNNSDNKIRGLLKISSGSKAQQKAFQAFNEKWLLYLSPGLAFNNTTFCSHSVFTCFVWI